MGLIALQRIAVDENMEIFDILIIGGGPSALYEATVLSKTNLNVAMISESFGGCMEMLGDQKLQSYTDELEILNAKKRLTDYIKNPTALNPTGREYSSYIRDCIFDLKIKHIYGKVTHITQSESYFKIQDCLKKKMLFARKLILATGIISKKPELALPSHFWISCFEVYHHIYSNQLQQYANAEICIVGGGNTAFQLASILSKKAKNITLLVKRYLGLFPQETDDRFALRAHSQQTIELLTKTSVNVYLQTLFPQSYLNAHF